MKENENKEFILSVLSELKELNNWPNIDISSNIKENDTLFENKEVFTFSFNLPFSDIIPVRPMNSPTGIAFHSDFKYDEK